MKVMAADILATVRSEQTAFVFLIGLVLVCFHSCVGKPGWAAHKEAAMDMQLGLFHRNGSGMLKNDSVLC